MHIHSPYNRKAKAVPKEHLEITGHSYECLHINKSNCKCTKLEYVEHYKYLGLKIDKYFNWGMHVADVCSRLRCVLGRFYHLKPLLNRHTLLTVYYALADSLISYGLIVYGRTFTTYLNDVKNLQIRIIKFLATKKDIKECNGEYNKLFPLCKILPVHQKVEYLIGLDYYYSDLYKTVVSNKYNTKNTREKRLVKPKTNNYYGERTDRYVVPNVFNKVDILRKSPKKTLRVIKSKIRALLLSDK